MTLGMMIALMLQAALTFATVAQGSNSRAEDSREVVIRSTDEWQMLWRAHNRTLAPVIDFSTSMVVGIFLGSRPTAGYAVEVITVREERGEIVVEYRERAPARGALTAQVLTAPFHLVQLALHEGVVRFRKLPPAA